MGYQPTSRVHVRQAPTTGPPTSRLPLTEIVGPCERCGRHFHGDGSRAHLCETCRVARSREAIPYLREPTDWWRVEVRVFRAMAMVWLAWQFARCSGLA